MNKTSALPDQSPTKKKSHGQFYTTHHAYILQGLYVQDCERHLIEPFTGYGHLLTDICTDQRTVEMYDIDPKTTRRY